MRRRALGEVAIAVLMIGAATALVILGLHATFHAGQFLSTP